VNLLEPLRIVKPASPELRQRVGEFFLIEVVLWEGKTDGGDLRKP